MIRGQLRILENVFAVFILIIVLMLVLVMLFTNAFQMQRDDLERVSEREAVAIARFAASMPEIGCVGLEGDRPYCVDAARAGSFRDRMRSDPALVQQYYPYLGTSRISIGAVSGATIPIHDGLGAPDGIQAYRIPTLVAHASGYDVGWVEVVVVAR